MHVPTSATAMAGLILLGLVAVPSLPLAAQDRSASVSPPETQIALALQAAPEVFREGAAVVGYTEEGTVELLREGTNAVICLGPDPTSQSFSVACYHEGLEPYMARGRELAAQGVPGPARDSIRYAEVEAGELEVPYGAALHVLHGSGFDPETATIHDPFLRWVIYTPGATAESTGLRTDASEGEPWLMSAGTPGAHIMIVPPR
jgi:hypothetical protein